MVLLHEDGRVDQVFASAIRIIAVPGFTSRSIIRTDSRRMIFGGRHRRHRTFEGGARSRSRARLPGTLR